MANDRGAPLSSPGDGDGDGDGDRTQVSCIPPGDPYPFEPGDLDPELRRIVHAIVVQIEGASYRLRSHADLIPEHVRANAPIAPPPPPKRRGRPPKSRNGAANH